MTNIKLNRQRGKRAQKKIAELLDCLNIGTLGEVDILNEIIVGEVKDLAKFAGEKFLEQAEKYINKNNKYKNKIPTAIVHIRGKPFKKSIILLRLEDFISLMRKAGG